jgi:hypothetical protein
MLIVRSVGRLGNQLFIYSAAAKASDTNERLVLVGFSALLTVFPSIRNQAVVVPIKREQKWIWSCAEWVLRCLAKIGLTRLLTSVPDKSKLQRSKGLTGLTMFDAGFCQDQQLVDEDLVKDLLEKDFWPSEVAEKHLIEENSMRERKKTFFIHVRRGDYLSWPAPDAPAALPVAWYLDQISDVKSNFPNAKFQVYSDDAEYCENEFANIEDVEFVNASLRTSLIHMSLCDGGILSASSLSWWAAYFGAIRNNNNLYIGPEFWFGWPKSVWGQPSIEGSSFIRWAPVTYRSSGLSR